MTVFKNQKFFNFAFLFFFVNLLLSLVNYKSPMTLLLSREGASEQNLMVLKNSL